MDGSLSEEVSIHHRRGGGVVVVVLLLYCRSQGNWLPAVELEAEQSP